MTEPNDRPPISPDLPLAPGEDEAPDIEVATPDDRDTPDRMGVSDDAAAVEAPD